LAIDILRAKKKQQGISKILFDGTLTEFEESETNEETKIVGNIAQRFSKYKKSGYLNGIKYKNNFPAFVIFYK
jgi:hypothetical protein